MSSDWIVQLRIDYHKEQAEQAKLQGDHGRYCQERRAMLLAQAEWWEQNHRRGDVTDGELPY